MDEPNSRTSADVTDSGSSVLIVEDNPEFVFHLSFVDAAPFARKK